MCSSGKRDAAIWSSDPPAWARRPICTWRPTRRSTGRRSIPMPRQRDRPGRAISAIVAMTPASSAGPSVAPSSIQLDAGIRRCMPRRRGAARIQTLQLRLEEGGGHLDMTLPPDCALHLFGDLSRLTADGEPPGSLTLAPTLGRRPGMAPYVLPDLGCCNRRRRCRSMAGRWDRRFPARHRALSGADAAHAMGPFRRLGRAVAAASSAGPGNPVHARPAGLPPLDSWPLLDRFIAYNVDEAAGKRLRAQMKARGQQRAWTSHASVSQLRKPEWWQREYGRPFRAGAAVRPRRRTRPMMRRGTHSTARRMSRRRRRRSRPSPRISTR